MSDRIALIDSVGAKVVAPGFFEGVTQKNITVFYVQHWMNQAGYTIPIKITFPNAG